MGSLNFPNAMRVSHICMKIMTIDQIGSMSPLEFTSYLIENSEEGDIEFLVSLVGKDCASPLTELTSLVLQNDILKMTEFFSQLGGK